MKPVENHPQQPMATPAANAPASAVLPFLAALAAEGRPLEASYRCGGWRVVLLVEPAEDATALFTVAGPPTPALSEMESEVLQAVAELGGRPVGERIAEAAGSPDDSGLRACLASLRSRGLLGGSKGEPGYSLTAEGREMLGLDAPAALPFVPTPFQQGILRALDGKALRTDALGAIVGGQVPTLSEGRPERAARTRPKGVREKVSRVTHFLRSFVRVSRVSPF